MKNQPPQTAAANTSLDWLVVALRVALGLVMVVSGALKAAAPAEEFSFVIEAYSIVPADMALSLAAFLPWAELLLGFSLITGYFTRLACAGAGAMLLTFVCAILSTKARGIELPNCGCFGSGFHPSATTTMLMDSALSVAAWFCFKRGPVALSLDHWAGMGQ